MSGVFLLSLKEILLR